MRKCTNVLDFLLCFKTVGHSNKLHFYTTQQLSAGHSVSIKSGEKRQAALGIDNELQLASRWLNKYKISVNLFSEKRTSIENIQHACKTSASENNHLNKCVAMFLFSYTQRCNLVFLCMLYNLLSFILTFCFG